MGGRRASRMVLTRATPKTFHFELDFLENYCDAVD